MLLQLLLCLSASLSTPSSSTQGDSCGDCASTQRRTVLCARHAGIEGATLREQKRNLRSKESSLRVAALERVAELTHTHANAASPAVARFLAEGLDDPSLAVRRVAVKLLAEGQNADEAARGMVRGLESAKETWSGIEERVADPRTGALEIDELTEVPAYFESVLEALGKLRDERSLQALLAYLRSPLERTPGRFLVVAGEATLALDTRRGTEAVITLLANLEAALAHGAIPRRFERADGRATLLDSMKARLDNATEAERGALLNALSAYAEKKLLAPESKPTCASDWRAWLESVRTQLPERLVL